MSPDLTNARPRPALLGISLKLYFGHLQTLDWCRQVAELATTHPAIQRGAVSLFIMPSFPSLAHVEGIFEGTPVKTGAQDLHWDDWGAYTGEVSGTSLREVGCTYVEVGHAERRRLFGETDEVIRAKTQAAFRNGLVPVICVGETEEGPADTAAEACVEQLAAALADSEPGEGSIVVAYEPVWAIGAEAPANAGHILPVTRRLRQWLASDGRYPQGSVIYGGSAGPGLLTRLAEGVDGLFLGRFAHEVKALTAVIDEAAEAFV
ncbi:triose-phosphate isomerase family protein [Sinomonas sp. P47F7]|uniref:triose-phosphate isomerase family protein n=1 Tax=Sinomonas sp. P47F7 TaxID=3410987 RepID=UPI003BF56BCA